MQNDLFILESALKNIKQIREQQGLTQKVMAEKIGISESFYCQLEGGKRKERFRLTFELYDIIRKFKSEPDPVLTPCWNPCCSYRELVS